MTAVGLRVLVVVLESEWGRGVVVVRGGMRGGGERGVGGGGEGGRETRVVLEGGV